MFYRFLPLSAILLLFFACQVWASPKLTDFRQGGSFYAFPVNKSGLFVNQTGCQWVTVFDTSYALTRVINPQYRSDFSIFYAKFKPYLEAIGRDPQRKSLREKMLAFAIENDPEVAELINLQLRLKDSSIGRSERAELKALEVTLVRKNLSKLVPPEILALGESDPGWMQVIIEDGLFVGVQLEPWPYYNKIDVLGRYAPAGFYKLNMKSDHKILLELDDFMKKPILIKINNLRISGDFIYKSGYQTGAFRKSLSDKNARRIESLTIDSYSRLLHQELTEFKGVISTSIKSLSLRREVQFAFPALIVNDVNRQVFDGVYRYLPDYITQGEWASWFLQAKLLFPNLKELQLQYGGVSGEQQSELISLGIKSGLDVTFTP